MLTTAEDTSNLSVLGEAVLRAFHLISNYVCGKLGERTFGLDRG